MKWTKLEYGKWPEGEIVIRIVDDKGEVHYLLGYSRSRIDNEWYFYDYDGLNIKLSIDSFYHAEPHYIELNKVEMPK